MAGGPWTAALGWVAPGEKVPGGYCGAFCPRTTAGEGAGPCDRCGQPLPRTLCPCGGGSGGHSEGGAGAQGTTCPPNSRFCCPLLKQPRGPGALAPPRPAQERQPRSRCLSWRRSLSGLFSSLHSALLPCGLRPLLSQDSFHVHPSCEVPAAGPEARVARPGRSGTLGSAGLGLCPDCGSQAQATVSEAPRPLPTCCSTLLWLGHVVAGPPGSRAGRALSPVPLFPPSAPYTHEQGCLPLRPLTGPQTPRRGPTRGYLGDAGPQRTGWDLGGVGSGLGVKVGLKIGIRVG